MAGETITTAEGMTVRLRPVGKRLVVVLDNPEAPDDMRNTEAGIVVQSGGFQPATFAAFALRPAVLRAIADLIEKEG